MSDWAELRFAAQSLLLGFGTDPHSMALARTVKAIKSENFGGPKAKHVEQVMNALCFSEINGPVVTPLDIVVCLGAINWRKESVRAIRIVGFLLIMLHHGSQYEYSKECHEAILVLLSEIENFWCKPEARPRVGYSHWDSPIVKQKFSNLMAYVRSKAMLLTRFRDQLPIFARSPQASWNPDFPIEAKVAILSQSLPAMSQLANAVSGIENTTTLTSIESAAFKAFIPQLISDMQLMLVVNTKLVVAVSRDASAPSSICDSLLSEYQDLREKLLKLRVTSRGSLELVFRPSDLPVVSKVVLGR